MSDVRLTPASSASQDVALPQPVSRRQMLRLALAGAGIVATGPVLARTGLLSGDPAVVRQDVIPGVISKPAPFAGPSVPKFERDLVLPAVLAPTTTRTNPDGKQVKVYDLEHKVSTAQILPVPFPATEIWGYNGTLPGPTIKQQRYGALTEVRNKNSLPAGHPYSMHLHGSPSQPFFDGHPDDLTQVGATKTYKYPNSQEARTLWYHDHAIHQTAEHVYKGLAGFFIQQPAAAEIDRYSLNNLPSGEYDVPLMVGDLQFDERGNIAYDDKGHDSLWGNVNVVNGKAFPYMDVDRTSYRFRMLVASVSRSYNFALSNGQAITVIGSDAGLLPSPVPVKSYRHGMAERYDVVIDFSKLAVGTKVTLLNTTTDGDMRQVMQFVVGSKAVTSKPLPAKLNDVVFPAESAVAVTREFKFDRTNGLWAINGLTWDGSIAATPKVGTTEKWILRTNGGGWFHPVHIHLVDFQILRRNGQPALPYEKGWKDVVYVGRGESVELLMTFHEPEKIDPTKPTLGKFVMHCHNLVHEDHDMMNQFEIHGGHGDAVAARASMPPAMMVQWSLEA